MGASGTVVTLTTTAARGLSQPTVWDTQYVVVPATAVEGVGAVELPVPLY